MCCLLLQDEISLVDKDVDHRCPAETAKTVRAFYDRLGPFRDAIWDERLKLPLELQNKILGVDGKTMAMVCIIFLLVLLQMLLLQSSGTGSNQEETGLKQSQVSVPSDASFVTLSWWDKVRDKERVSLLPEEMAKIDAILKGAEERQELEEQVRKSGDQHGSDAFLRIRNVTDASTSNKRPRSVSPTCTGDYK